MKPIKFVEDKGITRSSKTHFNRSKVEDLVKLARTWLNKNKGKVCSLDLTEIEKHLGVTISNANNFAWMFNPKNKHAPFSDIALKNSVKVGAHFGRTKTPKEKQSNYFRELTDSERDDRL